jgi:hypothetical protein
METFLFSLKRYGDGMPTSPFHVKGMWMVAYIYVSYKHEIIYKWHAYPGSYTMFGRVGEGLEGFGKDWEGLKGLRKVWEGLEGFGEGLGEFGKVWQGLVGFGKVWRV